VERKEFRDRMDFKNGWALSIICGPGTYSDEGTFEVGVLDPKGNLNYEYTGGDVAAYQSIAEIEDLAKTISSLRS